MYDYLIVGSGLFGAVFAHESSLKGKRCLVIDKRDHIGGNIYTYEQDGIIVHAYGAHIFHTDNPTIADYMKRFSHFNRFTNSPIAVWKDKMYNLPFNMNTFHQLWDVKTPDEARAIIDQQRNPYLSKEPENLEEYALSQVGTDIYERLIKGYTEKQWGRSARELPISIMRRIPLRFTYDNNYYNDDFQGIPDGGYTPIIGKMLEKAEVKLNTPFEDGMEALANKVIYTGPIDAYHHYCFGPLEYRSLRFETTELDQRNHQGNAVMNYTERAIPFTRVIEHKHFAFGTQKKTIITHEYPANWSIGDEPYYPINNDTNDKLYKKYKSIPTPNFTFAGRLGSYRYYDMQDTIRASLELAQHIL